MNRIVSLTLPAATAFVFFLIACGNESNPLVPPPEKNGQTDLSSSSGGYVTAPPTTPYSSSTNGGATNSSPSVGSSSSGADGSSPSETSSSSKPSSSSFNSVATPKADFTETVGGVTFNMIYILGGEFTLGCDKSSGCPADAKPVTGVKVSNYFIGKTEVTNGLWKAVMGNEAPPPQYSQSSGSATHIDWYQAMEFTCKLSQKTGRRYHMVTEAEWEYAAKNHLSKLEKIDKNEEWAYNSWKSEHSGGTDPVGPMSGMHTQKTRRDANITDNITGRLIRSIDGIGPALRLAVSADMDYPPDMVSPCDIHAPHLEGGEPVNSYRDKRWVTGSGARWRTPPDAIAMGSFDLRVWDDGTARLGSTNGQWFTSNNIAFVFVPNSGSAKKYAYIFLDETQGSLITDKDFNYMNGDGYVGRILKETASNYDKPTISGLKSGEELARAQSNFETDYKMIDMTNIPESAKKQDSRLLDGTDQGWFQDNRNAGGTHHYRKDVDLDEFRFTVNLNGNRIILANGNWFTVNNTFLRVTHKNGYVADYLYAVTPDGTFYHNSFMAYERADFRMFKKTANGSATFNETCGSICSGEIPKGEAASMYSSQGDKGKSTFVPAPCPVGGCK